jgi:hypothetical protein
MINASGWQRLQAGDLGRVIDHHPKDEPIFHRLPLL